MALYPWQIDSWQQLVKRHSTLPHALLLTGNSGIGKRHFAQHLAQSLLCEAEDSVTDPCGRCVACNWCDEGHHPDLRILSTEDGEPADADKKTNHFITIETVRLLQEFIYVASHRRRRRVVIVYPAEAMNTAAANAFLKMLEEPPPGVQFILVSHRWQTLLATIKSRCQRVVLPTPDRRIALAWLAEQHAQDAAPYLDYFAGAPLRAAGHLQAERALLLNTLLPYLAAPAKWSVVELADEIEKLKRSTGEIIDCLQRWVADSILYQQTGQVRYYPAYQTAFAQHRLFGPRVWEFYRLLITARRHAQHPLNQRLLLEQLFYRWLAVLTETQVSKSQHT